MLSSALLVAALGFFLFRFGSPRRAAAVILSALLLDQLAQAIVARHFLLHAGPTARITLLGGRLMIAYVENRQLGFGRGEGDLLTVTLLLVCLLGVLYIRLARHAYRMAALTELACSLLAAGLLGILVDRVRIGYVVDFLRLIEGSPYAWNLADLAAVGAAGCVLLRGVELFATWVGADPLAKPPSPPARPPAGRAVAAMLALTVLALMAIWRSWPV